MSTEADMIDSYLVYLRRLLEHNAEQPVSPELLPALVQLLKTRASNGEGLNGVIATLGLLA